MRSSVATVALMTWCCSLCGAAELLAHWPMEEMKDGVVADASGHGHHAVAQGLEGKLPEVVPGIVGNGLRFTGSAQQVLEIAQSEALQSPGDMTVMAWIKPVARDGTYEIIGNKGDKSGAGPWPGWRLRYFWSRATFQYGTADATEPSVSSPEWSTPANFWSHVALATDGKQMILYINCEPLVTAPMPAPILAASRPLLIGNYIGRKNAYAFDGLMDEVKVFGECLDGEGIYQEAARGMAR